MRAEKESRLAPTGAESTWGEREKERELLAHHNPESTKLLRGPATVEVSRIQSSNRTKPTTSPLREGVRNTHLSAIAG